MYATPFAIATGLPRCTLAPDGRSGRTARMRPPFNRGDFAF